MQEQEPSAVLRIRANGGVRVEAVSSTLAAIDQAYNGVSVFIDVLDDVRRLRKEYPLPARYWPFESAYRVFNRRRWLGETSEVAKLVPSRDRLILRAVRLESPGFFDFLGKLNPLEVLRQYLNDRHERQKDEEYRNQAERDRLFLENEIRRNQVIRERIEIAKELGATERDLAPLINVLVARPLEQLNHYQDQNLITQAEQTRREG